MSRKGGLSTTRYSSDSSITVKPCGILARSTRVGDKAGIGMISLKNVTRYYRSGERSVHALDGISLEIAQHEFVSIAGPSGCGKSTLIHLLAGLDTPTS